MPSARRSWQQATAVVSLSASGALTGLHFVPHAAGDAASPSNTGIRLLALEQSARPAASGHADAALRAAIVNVAHYYLRLAETKTPAEMEAIIWQHDSMDGADHGQSCAAFASLTLELASQVVGQDSWVTGGTSYPWPLHEWADVRVDPNPDSMAIISVLQDAEAHQRWHALGDGYAPQSGDWVVFHGHVEVVTSYADGVLRTIGGDSRPNFSVNAHEYGGSLTADGVVGFVNNGNLTADAGSGSGSSGLASRGGAEHGSSSPAAAAPGQPHPGQPQPGQPQSGRPSARADHAGWAQIPGIATTAAGTTRPAPEGDGATGDDRARVSSASAPTARPAAAEPATRPSSGATANSSKPQSGGSTGGTQSGPAPSGSGGARFRAASPVAAASPAIPGVPSPAADPAEQRTHATRGAGRAHGIRSALAASGTRSSHLRAAPRRLPARPPPPIDRRPADRAASTGTGIPRSATIRVSIDAPGPAIRRSPVAHGPVAHGPACPSSAHHGPAAHCPAHDGPAIRCTAIRCAAACRPAARCTAACGPGRPPPARAPQAAVPAAAPAPVATTPAVTQIPGLPPTAADPAADRSPAGHSPANGDGSGSAGPADPRPAPRPTSTNAAAPTPGAPSTAAPSTAAPSTGAPSTAAPSTGAAAAQPSNPADGTAEQQEFIASVAPGAMAAQQQYGVPASVTIAQAIDESSWGESSLATQDHNLFGIKGTGPAGSDARLTQEFENGEWVTRTALFRVYHDTAESISDHGRLLATSGYYRRSMAERQDPDAFANGLTGIYATDPDYGAKLITLMQDFDLYRYNVVTPGDASAGPAARTARPARARPRKPAAPAARPSVSATAAASGNPGSAQSQGVPSLVKIPGLNHGAGTSPVPAAPAQTPVPAAPQPPPAPVGSTPAQAAPAPAPAAPGQTAPAQTTPAQTTPARTTPARTTPAQTVPAWSAPVGATLTAATGPAVQTMAAPRGGTSGGGALYRHRVPPSVWSAFAARARPVLLGEEPLYSDVAACAGIRWELLAACDWMQCEAHPRFSPVQGEKLGAVNPDGTVYRTRSEALSQCASDLVELSQAVYGIDITSPGSLSVRQLANVFAAFRWGGLLRLHHTSAMEFPYSVAGLTVQLTGMRWPNIAEQHTPDKPGSRFRRPFGAVPVVLGLKYPALA